ncbi:MAG: hypothetical protein E6R03_10555 [Hyphomicrobiaceae bacterium]|nr:MAG: hypothetical protein E6R03_10555 [Hyphomicrobiaceae bacterium]
MIIQWYVGFVGDFPERKARWFDVLTKKGFRHVLAIGYDPIHRVWIYYDPNIFSTNIQVFDPDDEELNSLIYFVKTSGAWLRVKPRIHACLFGRWRHYCVPAIKHLVGSPSSALTPYGFYRDLIREGAKPAFEV